MLVSWQTCYSDEYIAILNDSTEILLNVMGREKDSNIHKNVALSGSWALANLVDALAKNGNGGSSSITDFQLEHQLLDHGDERASFNCDFPPHLILQLAKVAIR